MLRHSWGWLLEQGTDPFLLSVVVILVCTSSVILFVQTSVLRRDVNILRTDVDLLRDDVDALRVDLDRLKEVFSKFLTIFSASKTVKQDAGLEGSLRAFTAFVGAQSNSPLIINEKGRGFLVESHLGEFVRQKKDEMFALLG